jgi:hypothetical protein
MFQWVEVVKCSCKAWAFLKTFYSPLLTERSYFVPVIQNSDSSYRYIFEMEFYTYHDFAEHKMSVIPWKS